MHSGLWQLLAYCLGFTPCGTDKALLFQLLNFLLYMKLVAKLFSATEPAACAYTNLPATTALDLSLWATALKLLWGAFGCIISSTQECLIIRPRNPFCIYKKKATLSCAIEDAAQLAMWEPFCVFKNAGTLGLYALF